MKTGLEEKHPAPFVGVWGQQSINISLSTVFYIASISYFSGISVF
jgi:hypothetical protein